MNNFPSQTEIEYIIKYQAFKAKQKIPHDPILSLEDFIQEGWVICEKTKKRWKPTGGATFKTYLTVYLIRGFRLLVCNRAKEYYAQKDKTSAVEIIRDRITPITSRETFHCDYISRRAERFLSCAFSPSPELIDYAKRWRCGTFAQAVGKWLGFSDIQLGRIRRELFSGIAR